MTGHRQPTSKPLATIRRSQLSHARFTQRLASAASSVQALAAAWSYALAALAHADPHIAATAASRMSAALITEIRWVENDTLARARAGPGQRKAG